MDRQYLAKTWDEGWNTGLWAASWEQSVGGLTAQQASWKPAPQRHSIWQIVEHIIYWRQVQLRRLETGQEPTSDELAQRNYPDPVTPSEAAWAECRKKLEDSQSQIAGAIRAERNPPERLAILLFHDCYHFGQINYLRALAGMKPIE